LAAQHRGWAEYRPQFLADRALTAFAQLATLRLGVRRSLISLVDSQNQYILTEATRSLSLTRHTIEVEEDKIWLGSSIVTRQGGVPDHVFKSTYSVTDSDGSLFTGEGFVCTDMREHEEFKARPYVIGEPHIVFYAGVPIRSRSGHFIGVYAASHTEPRAPLTADEFRFLQDMAETVMYHFEMIRDREDRDKGERMVKGLAEFIEGSCALGKGVAMAPAVNGIKKTPNGAISNPSTSPALLKPLQTASSKVLERQTLNIRSMSEESIPIMESVSHIPGPKSIAKVVKPDAANPTCIFFRAADLMRRATYADGVCFFRANGINLRTKVPESLSSDDTSFDDSHSPTSGSEPVNSSSPKIRFPRAPKFTTHKLKRITSIEKDESKPCEVLGLSISEGVPHEEALSARNFVFSEQSMEKYIKKFPYGKFFSFSERGSGISSGDDKSELEHGEPHQKTGATAAIKPNRAKFIPTELLKVLPGVRTLIFLPLWDPAAERWVAGGFIWTTQEGQLLSPHNELPYLRAFGNSITSEYARMNALIADKAKSDFISSISHELRSPLHGILGSVEFINETELSSYQSSLVSSIETCSTTLLETLEHILDYAKINKLYGRDKVTRRMGARKKDAESSIMGPTADIDLNQVLEEVSESVCAGHAFRETHGVAGMPADQDKVKNGCNLKRVSTSIEILPRLEWMVKTQPGAIRRIVMNLLGNALKYTPDGFISIAMRSQPSLDPTKVDVSLIFEDSGVGMSLEYQRTRLFSPFSQADPFSDGLGLGLSIVRQIVDSMGGHVEIRSEKGVGTVAKVHLSLPLTETPVPDDFDGIQAVTAGKRVAVVCPAVATKRLAACGSAMEANAMEWLGIEILPASCGTDITAMGADAIICPEIAPNLEEIAASKIPLIIACANQSNLAAVRKRVLSSHSEHRQQSIHIVAQPLGPHKMGPIFKQLFSPQSDLRPIDASNHQREPQQQPIVIGQTPPAEAVKIDVPPAPFPISTDSPEVTLIPKPIPMSLKSGLAPETPGSILNHVLLVDDNAINLKLLTMFMGKIGLSYARASDGLQALEQYKKHAACVAKSRHGSRSSISRSVPANIEVPELHSNETSGADTPKSSSNEDISLHPFTWVLMDLSMPVMDGLESTRRIRAYEREHKIKKAVVVALTGLASADAQQDALDAGVDFYLAKPVRFADLKKLMEV
jgi:signal transduction histidine kinase/CheY-like chemotaxis protein